MSTMLHYKEYYGYVEYSAEDRVFWGKIEGIHDVVTCEATDVDGLHRVFQETVEQYLARCRQQHRQAQNMLVVVS